MNLGGCAVQDPDQRDDNQNHQGSEKEREESDLLLMPGWSALVSHENKLGQETKLSSDFSAQPPGQQRGDKERGQVSI
jgi:hypothetical protein